MRCDLASFASVRDAAAEVRVAAADGLDCLCNNAGVMALKDEATVDGYDVQMQTNHLGHFLLTCELMPLLEKAAARRGEARVVNHTSDARKMAWRLEEADLEQRGGELGGDAVGVLSNATGFAEGEDQKFRGDQKFFGRCCENRE